MSQKLLGYWKSTSVVLIAIALLVAMVAPAVAQDGGPNFTLRVVGILEALNSDNVVVSGQTFDITNATVAADLEVGDLVQVTFTLDLATGERTAISVTLFELPPLPTPELNLVGELEEIGADYVVVYGFTFDTTNAEVDEGLVVGDLVRVRFTVAEDGSFIASEVHKTNLPTPPAPPTGELVIYGRLDAIEADSLTVAGRIFDTTNAEVEAGLEVGDWVLVTFTIAEDGSLVASSVILAESPEPPQPPTPPQHPHVMVGELETLNADSVVVKGQTFDTTSAEVEEGVAEGDWVRVEYTVAEDGSFVATHVAKLQLPQRPNVFTTIGELTELNADTAIIGGLTYDITEATIEEGVEIGDLVRVTFHIENTDSTITLVAVEIQKLATLPNNPNNPTQPPVGQPPVGQPPVNQPLQNGTPQAPQNPSNPQNPGNPAAQPPNNNSSNVTMTIVGVLEAIGTDSITVNGQVIRTMGLNVAPGLQVGMTVRVEVRIMNGVVSGFVNMVQTQTNNPAQPPVNQPPNNQPPVNQPPNGQPPQLPTLPPPNGQQPPVPPLPTQPAS